MQQTNHSAPQVPDGAPVRTEVVIVGAGPAGIAVAACLSRAGLPFILLERGNQIATSWYGHYERLHLHTPKAFSGLPYFPIPRHYPRYPSRLQMIDYLEVYAAQFDIRPHFGQNVVAVRQIEGLWCTETEDGLYLSPSLVIATGLNSRPYQPSWPGQEQFGGPIVHSSAYRNGKPYRDKRMLVVGFGNSGGEIAIDLVEHGARSVALSVRGPVNVISRDLFGVPILAFAIVQRKLPPRLADAITMPLMRLQFGALQRYGLNQATDGPMAQIDGRGRIPLIDIGTMRLIREGKVEVRPGIRAFSEHGVVFVKGREEEFDGVILATGYRPAINTFLAEVSSIVDKHGVPRSGGAESDVAAFYFCGFTTSPTGMLREIGIEARRIARAISARS
jgi:cation diffusion facilitator CzcD-associated flavoprotein CzcO